MKTKLFTFLTSVCLVTTAFAQVPVITSFTPLSGPIGSTVIITGSGFSTTPANNFVSFQGIKATVTVATATSLTTIVPAGASFGPISIIVNNLTAISSRAFNASISCNNSSFKTVTNIAVTYRPYTLSVGDFNNDGKQDIVTADGGSNSVSVQLGTGFGTFSNQKTFAVGDSPDDVSVGDFNKDGILDLVTVSYFRQTYSVLLGTGIGTFLAQKTYDIYGYPSSVSVGDFNGDGKLDLVTNNNDYVSVLLGIGDGTFLKPRSYLAGRLCSKVAIGDFNGDGKQDLATANSEVNNVSVLLGLGNGAFQTQVTYALGFGTTPASVTVGDFNGDGKQDLATCNTTERTVTVLLGKGDGIFVVQASYDVGGDPREGCVGDFNGDGNQDFAFANKAYTNITVLLGSGTGTFSNLTQYTVGNNPGTVSIGDFNEDEKQDLLIPNSGSYSVSILFSTCTPFPPIITSFTPASGTIGSSVTITGSGYSTTPANNIVTFQGIKATVTAATATSLTVTVPAGASFGPISLKVNNLTATSSKSFDAANACSNSSFAAAISNPLGTSPISVSLGDFNGDGKQDLVTANNSSNNVSVELGTGAGTFQASTTYMVGAYPISVSVGDFNGDGKQDLATANYNSNNVSVLLGIGNGTFQAQTTYAVGFLPYSVKVADFNNDGNQDLATANANSNNVSILLGTGSGTFLAQTKFAVGTYPISVVIGDFNVDGKQDLATTNATSNNISVLLGTGTGTFLAQTTYVAGTLPSSVSVGDLNGDGKQDLAIANATSNNLSVLLGTGTGTFQAQTTYAVGTYPLSVFVGDFNGDGKQDLATANYNSNNVSVLLGNGNGIFLAQTTYAVGSLPYSISVGDFNGDGNHDLVTANVGSNDVSVLISNCNRTGSNFTYPINIGTLAQGAVYTSTQNNNPANGFKNDVGQASDDIFYSFTITQQANVSISHCNSTIYDSYLHLYNAAKTEIAFNDDYGPSCSGSYKSSLATNLAPGTYYIASEGYNTNVGDITTEVRILPCASAPGNILSNPILINNNVGVGTCFSFLDFKNNAACFGNDYVGQPSDDIYYKFTLSSTQTVTISNCTSELYDSYVSLLDANGAFIVSNDDGPGCTQTYQSFLQRSLNAGTYYIVQEGYSTNSGYINMSFKTGGTNCRLEETQDEAKTKVYVSDEPTETTSGAFLYPNPTSEKVTISIPGLKEKATIKLSDLSGQSLMIMETNTINTEINTSELVAGLYYVSIQFGNTTSNLKVQVVK
ncbi:MAG: VCBS repeat-containing protein [Opitutaceae bacterium]|nr:VCBS repeat-containing protein [Cytophagales bacterium]